MLVKYCNKCVGHPYTQDLNITYCPKCGTYLQSEIASEADLSKRRKFSTEKEEPEIQKNWSDIEIFSKKEEDLTFERNIFPFEETEPKPDYNVNAQNFDNTLIRGKVSQYSSSGKEDGTYRRLLPVKIFQAIVYRQRLEDVLHRFAVRVEHNKDSFGHQSHTDIPVNVHGTISGGLQITDNSEVEVHGKYHNGVLMADSIYIINNGYKSKVGFQHSIKAIVYGILSAIMLLFVCFVAASSNGGFFTSLKEFCTVWLVAFVILTVLYLLTSLTKIGLIKRMFAKKRPSFPLFGLLLTSLALAFLFLSAFGSFTGFGAYLTGWVYSVIPLVVVIVAIFFMIKSLF